MKFECLYSQVSDCGQQSFLPKEFSDENDLAILVQRLLSDLVSDISIVRNHVIGFSQQAY